MNRTNTSSKSVHQKRHKGTHPQDTLPWKEQLINRGVALGHPPGGGGRGGGGTHSRVPSSKSLHSASTFPCPIPAPLLTQWQLPKGTSVNDLGPRVPGPGGHPRVG